MLFDQERKYVEKKIQNNNNKFTDRHMAMKKEAKEERRRFDETTKRDYRQCRFECKIHGKIQEMCTNSKLFEFTLYIPTSTRWNAWKTCTCMSFGFLCKIE